MSALRVYVAGPMSNLPDFNYPAFYDAEKRLSRFGYDVENPARHFDGDQTRPYKDYMREAVRALTRCDAIYLMDGWEQSEGARFELEVSRRIGLAVMFEQDLEALEGD